MVNYLILSSSKAASSILKGLLMQQYSTEVLPAPTTPKDHETTWSNEQQEENSSIGYILNIDDTQFDHQNDNLSEIISAIDANYAIVLYWQNALSSFVTNKKYDTRSENPSKKLKIIKEELNQHVQQQMEKWRQIGERWQLEIEPIFIECENLFADPAAALETIVDKIPLAKKNKWIVNGSMKPTKFDLPELIENWDALPDETKNASFDVKNMLTKGINELLQIPEPFKHLVQEREFPIPEGGWICRISEPYVPDISKCNVMDAIDSNSISSVGHWPAKLASKLRKLFGCPVALPCCNGFTALFLALQACNVGPDDEVVIPALTTVAVSNAIRMLGARPVFVDSAMDNYNPGYEEFTSAVRPCTKAIVVTHTYGMPTPGIDQLVQFCKDHSIMLIEDISESIGVNVLVSNEERLLGTFGDFACASMYFNKTINAADGGFVLAKDARIECRLRSIVNHGFTPSYHFVHFEVSINGKINGLGAALACGCIDVMDEQLSHRSHVAQVYRTELASTKLKILADHGAAQNSPWSFTIECETSEQKVALRRFLAKCGIETSNLYLPLHVQPVNRDLDHQMRQLKNAEHFSTHCLQLPCHYGITDSHLTYICSIIKISLGQKMFKQSSNPTNRLVKNSSVSSQEHSTSKLCHTVDQRRPYNRRIPINC